MSIIQSIIEYKFIILFYLIIILLIYKNRKKFEFQAKIIALYRTKIGVKSMEKIGKKYSKIIKIIGVIGVIIGFIGMLLIMFLVIKGLYELIFVPEAPPIFSPVIPGVKIPGAAVFVPFWHGIIALFLVIVIHEFSHGIVAVSHGLKIKSSGFVMFGPLPGAFVEPEEKKLMKSKPWTQLSVYAAGPFSNILTGIIVILLTSLLISQVISNTVITQGFSFTDYTPKYSPAREAGLKPNVTYNKVNNITVKDVGTLLSILSNTTPGSTLIISNENESVSITTGKRPDDEKKAYLGVMGLRTEYKIKEGFPHWLFNVLLWIVGLLKWIYILSIGIGMANLLPLGPVDGGRMYYVLLRRVFSKKKADKIWAETSKILLTVILVLVIIPIIRSLL